MKIGKKAQELFTRISEEGKLSAFFEARLNYSLNNREILKKVNPNETISDIMLDDKGNRRYYSNPIIENGTVFLLSNDWYPKNEALLKDISKFADVPLPESSVQDLGDYSVEKKRTRAEWPQWTTPSDKELLVLTHTLTQYTHFLHPEIVKMVVEDNLRNKENWSNLLRERKVNPEIYLWDRSSCTFPGIRRYQGSQEIAIYRKQRVAGESVANALRLDDNDYPKHLWSFIFRGDKFKKKGPDGYSLAHICDHKDYKNRCLTEFSLTTEDAKHPLCGLYTSASNTVYTPTALLKPTDHSEKIRRLLIKKAHSLYGEFCELTPDWLQIKNEDDPEWDIKNFTWTDPVGTTENLNQFLNFRANIMSEMLK